jgi:hypothetical protein
MFIYGREAGMSSKLAYGGLVIADGGAATQALTTTAGQVVAWGAKGMQDSNNYDGDPSVIPDLTNNRIKVNGPGIYLVTFNISMTGGGTQDVIGVIRKNAVAVTGGSGRVGIGTARANLTVTAIVQILPADIPKTIQTFSDPASTSFAGAGGAPKAESYIDVTLATVASTVTATLEAASLTVLRLDG